MKGKNENIKANKNNLAYP